jgi:hypothetical protein
MYRLEQSLHDQTSAEKSRLDEQKSTVFRVVNCDPQNHPLHRLVLQDQAQGHQ